jgi:hypothetical protein
LENGGVALMGRHYGKPSPTGPRALLARQREARALDLWLAGRRTREIGEELGVTHSAVTKMLQRVLEQTKALTEERADELRAQEGAKLDAAAAAIWPQVAAGDARAQDTWLRNRARFAALFGLDRAVPPAQITNAPVSIRLEFGKPDPPADVLDGEVVDLPALEAGNGDS